MDRFVAKLNIEHFRKLLAAATDDVERQRLRTLLEEEEARLAAAQKQHAKPDKQG